MNLEGQQPVNLFAASMAVMVEEMILSLTARFDFPAVEVNTDTNELTENPHKMQENRTGIFKGLIVAWLKIFTHFLKSQRFLTPHNDYNPDCTMMTLK